MKREDNQIIITTDENKQLIGEIVFSFEANGDEFVLYVIDEIAYVAKVINDEQLQAVEDDEWPLIEQIVDDYLANEEIDDDEHEDPEHNVEEGSLT